MPSLLPQDGFDTYITSSVGAADTTIYVNENPIKTAGYLTIYDTDGRTILEKIKYTGIATSPNRLTGCVRGLSNVDIAGVVSDAAGVGVSHPANVRIAMCENIHYLGRALSQLNGNEEMGGVMQLPAARVIDGPRDVVDKEYADGLTVSAVSAFAVTQNGADPSLTINVGAGRYLKSDKTTAAYAGASAQAVTPSQTNYVELNPSTGTLSINTSAFTAGSIPLARVVTSGTDITSITDDRPFIGMHDGLVDVVRTWTTTQTFTADLLQINTDANSDNDPVRRSYMRTEISGGGVPGTSGEAFALGQNLYLKASDQRLYKGVATGDESTYSFVGLALVAATGAGEAVYFAPPGHIVTGLAGLTAGAYYYISDTAGVSATTPGTRYAKVAQALSTTVLRVLEPKFIRRGSQTITSATTFVQTTGFYPGKVSIKAALPAGGTVSGASIGSDGNSCIAFRLVGASNDAEARASDAWYCYDKNVGVLRNAGTVSAKSSTGFTLNCTTYGADVSIQWEAESL